VNFFDELKRRNVFRVGIAYGVAAWLVLQVADLVLENIGAPDWMIKALMFFVALGFVAAVIIAWAYELTPEGIRREADIKREDSVTVETGRKLNVITLLAVLALLAFMVLDRFVLEKPLEPAATTEAAVAPGAPAATPDSAAPGTGEQSIAVLPFVDMSPEGDQAYFADGIAEEILNVLVKTHSLKVAGRTSSFQFRGRNEDLRLIGEQLGVAHILEGSIRKSGDRLRITAQLVKAGDGFHLWSETYDRELTDIFAIQDEIARAITDALAVELNLDEGQTSLAGTPTTNMQAYDRYLEGRALIASRSDFPLMLRSLEEATRLDPEFAEGWAALAQAWALTMYYGFKERDTALREAERFARYAIELKPGLSEAHSALGDALRDQLLWNEAYESYQRALELNPDNVETHSQLGQMLMRAGNSAEALVHSSRSVQLDPLSWVNQSFYAVCLYAVGRKQEAFDAIDRAEALSDSSRSLVTRLKVRMALTEGMIEEARESVARFAASSHDDVRLDEFFFLPLSELFDKPAEARAYLGSLDHESLNNIGANVFWPAYFEDFDLARAWMNEVMGRMDIFDDIDLVWMQFPPIYPLYGTNEFKQIIVRSRLDMFWRVHGWPGFCDATGPLDFECGAPE